MNSDESWLSLSQALDQALDLEESARAAWLRDLASKDPPLAARLAAILDKQKTIQRQGFLDGAASAEILERNHPNLAGSRIGPFVIDAEAGHGGMGTVWRAHRDDGKFNQTVAIKFLTTHWADREGQARYQREVRLLSRLDHPNIARLIDAGVDASSQPYLVLEFVAGEPIDEYCRRQGLGIEAILDIFLPLLAAVAHAHRQLIVHRDIKPSNVMISQDGTPKLLDFGIARLLQDSDEDAPLTRVPRASPMTPGYAAPEQLLGEPADTLTDVYSLGALLYELLTGFKPYDEPGQSAEARLGAIMSDRLSLASGRPGAPRALRGDLDNILSKTLRRDRQQRYASVAAFADDIRRYLAHEPVAARAPTFSYRATRFMRRNRFGVAIAAVALVAITAALITALAQKRVAETESARATRELSYSSATHEFMTAILQQGSDQSKTTQQLLDAGESLIERQFGASPALRARLLYALAEQFGLLEQPATAQGLLRKADRLAQAAGDAGLQSIIRCDLGESLGYTGDFDSGMKLLNGEIDRIDPRQYATVYASCLASRGILYSASSNWQAAERDLRKALQTYAQTHTSNERGVLQAREVLAGILSARGNSSAAAQEYRELLDAVARLGRNNTSIALKFLNNYGLVMIDAGQIRAAEEIYAQAIQRQTTMDSGQLGDPAIFGNTGRVYEVLGHPELALPMLEKARVLAEHNGIKTWMAGLAIYEGKAWCEMRNVERAASTLRKAAALTSQAFPIKHKLVGHLHVSLGCLAVLQGQPQLARAEYQQAVDTYESLGLSKALTANALAELASAEVANHDLEAAERAADLAISNARAALGDFQHSLPLGRALIAKAQVEQARGRPSESAVAAADSELQANLDAAAIASLLRVAGLAH